MSIYISDQQLPNTTYGGYCRDPQYDKSIIDFIHVTDVQECHIKCRNTNYCAAFAFNSRNTAGLPNCDLYRGGPYMQGTGASRIICYVFQGILLWSKPLKNGFENPWQK